MVRNKATGAEDDDVFMYVPGSSGPHLCVLMIETKVQAVKIPEYFIFLTCDQS